MIVSYIRLAKQQTAGFSSVERFTESYRQCAFVCRSWSKEFWPLLVEDIIISRTPQVRQLCEILLPTSTQGPVERYHGDVALVRTISVKPTASPAEHERPCLELVLASPLPRASTNLGELRSFGADSISKGLARAPPQLALPALLRPLRRLTHLHMTGTTFRTFAQLVSIIRAVQAPSYIRLDDVSFSRQGPVHAASLTAARARLQQLSFRGVRSPFAISESGASPLAALVANQHVLQLLDVTAHDITAISSICQDSFRLVLRRLSYQKRHQLFTEVSFALQFHRHHNGTSLLRNFFLIFL